MMATHKKTVRRKRGRPSKVEGPLTNRHELLGVAARVIGRDGLAKASMRGIARESGVSLGTLQNHFSTKEEVWKAVIDELIVPAEEQFETLSSAKAMVTEVVRHRLASAVRNPGLAGRVLTDGSPEGEEVLDYLVQATHSGQEARRQLLEQAMAAGVLRRVDSDALIAVLGVSMSALASSKNALRKLQKIDLNDNAERERFILALSDILLNGLLPHDQQK